MNIDQYKEKDEFGKFAIIVNMVEFKPMMYDDFVRSYVSNEQSENMPPKKPGYLLKKFLDYDYYWIDKNHFERHFLKIESDNSISRDDVVNFIGHIDKYDFDDKSTLVVTETVSGFREYEFSSCIDPTKYDSDIGEKIALKKIVDKLYMYLGFVLSWAKNGLKTIHQDEKARTNSKIE